MEPARKTLKSRHELFTMSKTALFALAAATTLATAQDLSIAPVVYVMDGWTITSILDETDSVHSLLITRETPAPNPEQNITGVLAIRETAGWEASAWIGETTESILQWMHEELDLPDPLHPDSPWQIDGLNLTDPIVVAEHPVPFGKGIVASHPLAGVIATMEDPAPLLGLLEIIGQPAASGTITAGGSPIGGITEPGDPPSPVCPLRTAEQYWNAITASVEAFFVDPDSIHDVFNQTIDPLPIGQPRFCCWPRVSHTAHTVGPWVCGPWSIRHILQRTPALVSVSYWRVTNRFETRTCTRISLFCTPTITNQSRTFSGRQCYLHAFNRINQDGMTFTPPATPPAGASTPACTGPGCVPATGTWTPGC